MAIYWQKLEHKAQDERITKALEQNIDYKQKVCLGIPASRLDANVFYDQAPFLKDAPLLRTYVQNPNHIGCHTMGDSEAFFKGTQELEKEVIELLSVDMGTTMFGSVDDPAVYTDCMEEHGLLYKLHIDGAFGGFIYPFSNNTNTINFHNPNISSITLDAHKMLQAPYGTGIFLVRKGLMNYVCTQEAQYVSGMDITLSGSRSGANAIAIWMILATYGPFGWEEKIRKLLYRAEWCCNELSQLGIPHFRHPKMNVIAIDASYMPQTIVEKYGLVPDSHTEETKWFKIVVMDHVELSHLQDFISDMQAIQLQAQN